MMGGRRRVLGALASGPLAFLGRAEGAQGSRASPPPLAGLFDVTHFGAVPDGKTLCTKAIQAAIDACSAAGGGLVLIPPGHFLSGALFLKSNMHLHISPGATLQASQRFEDFPPIDGRAEGIERKTYSSLITGVGLENVTISGRGVLDGQGPPWWAAHETTRNLRLARNLPREAENPPEAPLRWPRPRVINLLRCQNVILSGLVVRDGPVWNVHLIYCQDVTVDSLTITGLQAQHTDGIVVDSCKRVRISNCSIGCGSESIALKSGYNEDGRRVGIPCEDVVITNCNLFFSLGSAIAVGSETAAGIRNVAISNCNIADCRYGIHIRSPRGRGGVVESIRASNLVIDRITDSAIMVSNWFDSVRMDGLFGEGAAPSGNPETDRTMHPPVGEGTPTLRDFEFSHITVGQVPAVATVDGLPERFIRGVILDDITAMRAKAGITCTRAMDITVSGLHTRALDYPLVAARDVQNLEVHRLRASSGGTGGGHPPIIHLKNVAGAFIHGCDVPFSGADFVRLEGTTAEQITIVDNNVPGAREQPAGGKPPLEAERETARPNNK